jgi:hypothetical protein
MSWEDTKAGKALNRTWNIQEVISVRQRKCVSFGLRYMCNILISTYPKNDLSPLKLSGSFPPCLFRNAVSTFGSAGRPF